jgi:hypothetical protein
MNEKEYFKRLVRLYEADKDLQEPAMDQATDTGADLRVDDSGQIPPEQSNQAPQEQPQDEGQLDDASYLSPEAAMPPQSMPESSEIHKSIRLFDLYDRLLEYIKTFYESIDVIDSNLLDKEHYIELTNKKDKIEKIINKLDYYMKEIFPVEKYEKSLYVYILLRTEVITMIKTLRDLLKLDQPNEKDDEKA